jgi:hypothetical protein
MAGKWTNWPKNIPASSIAGPSKLYPKRDFWFENKPSGKPALHGGKKKVILVG